MFYQIIKPGNGMKVDDGILFNLKKYIYKEAVHKMR